MSHLHHVSMGLNTAYTHQPLYWGHFAFSRHLIKWLKIFFQSWRCRVFRVTVALQPVCPFYPLTPDIKKDIFPNTTAARWIFLFFSPRFSCCENLTYVLRPAPQQARSLHSKSLTTVLFPHSDAHFELQQDVFSTSTWLNASYYCHVIGWLAICLHKKSNVVPNEVAGECVFPLHFHSCP